MQKQRSNPDEVYTSIDFRAGEITSSPFFGFGFLIGSNCTYANPDVHSYSLSTRSLLYQTAQGDNRNNLPQPPVARTRTRYQYPST
jgi:hypothetical protein